MLGLLLLQVLAADVATMRLNEAQTRYFDCASAAAVKWAKVEGALDDIADAAMGRCLVEEQAVETATRAWMAATGGGAAWIEDNIGRFTAEARRRCRQQAIGAVLDARR